MEKTDKIERISIKKESVGGEIPTRLFIRRTPVTNVTNPNSISTDEIQTTDL